jgi:hypothetical protein
MKLMVGKYSLKWNYHWTNNPHKNSLVTNVNEVEQYDLTYENGIQMKICNNKNEMLKHSLLKMKLWMYTIWTFFFRNEKIKHLTKNYCRWYFALEKQISIRTFTSFFNKRYMERKNMHTYAYYTKYVAILY